jgi:uncharacterized protein (DUF2141 family)
LTVSLRGVDAKRQGKLLCALYLGEKGFPMDSAQASQRVEATGEGATRSCVFSVTGAPVVAISVAHDENGNGTVDRNFLGIPKEGWASSNNVKPAMRAPSFDESKVAVSSAKSALSVDLHY